MILVSHWPPTSSNEYSQALALPDLVRTDMECLRSSRMARQIDYSSGPLLERHFSVLAAICHDQCLGMLNSYSRAKLEYDLAKKKTLEMKLNYIHQEVLAQTYTHQVVQQCHLTLQ